MIGIAGSKFADRKLSLVSITVHFIKLSVKNLPTSCRALSEIMNFLGVPQEVLYNGKE
jgi:hypothetical protein